MARIVDSAFEQELERRLAANQRQRLSAFNVDALAWLALTPGWTDQLALDCHFPTGNLSLDDFLKKAESAGLAQVQRHSDRTDFWMQAGMRQDILNRLQQDAGSSFLLQTCISVGQRLDKLRQQATPRIPQQVARWSILATRLTRGLQEASNWLDTQIVRLLEEDRTGEVVSWLDTARSLADLFGGELETAVRLGNRRLELAYRRRQDERHIADFLCRDEQIEAFKFLLDNREGVWALHFLGMGGVGKTMLLRYITAHLAPKDSIPTSRIDFDYISPDYPVRKPGQLLLELVAELRAHGLSATHLQRFTNSVANLHEALSKGETDYDPLSALSRYGKHFDAVARTFGNLIRELAQSDRPVVLILDTCEELAKFQPVGARLPAVEFTFAILERVHDILQRGATAGDSPFRVIFAGRRPLAQRGFEWELGPDQLGGKRYLLPDKKRYLALHELRGFNHQETREFLCNIKKIRISTPGMYKAILRHSQETGRSADIHNRWRQHVERRFHYNPFDLDLFADWIKADPEVSAEHITRDTQDPYIDIRILERLKQRELAHLLPALTLLGRFDEAVLRPLVADFGGDNFEETYRELGDQEWIDYQRDEALDTTFLQIDTNLLPRLRRYYNLDNPAPQSAPRYYLIEAARERLAPILEDLVKDPLTQLAAEHLNGALRVLPPERAARLWADVERRIPEQTNWAWASRVLSRILAEDGAVHQPAHPLWPAVQATLAAAQRHLQPNFNVQPLWQTVIETAGNHPDSDTGDWLQKRAFLGHLAQQRYDTPVSSEQVERLWHIATSNLAHLKGQPNADTLDTVLRSRFDQLNASVCAALATVVDAAEYHHARHLPDSAKVEAWADDLEQFDYPPHFVAFARMLAGRAHVLAGNQQAGNRLLDRAAWMLATQSESDLNRWFDWIPPLALKARLRLEALRLLPAELNSTQWDNLSTWRIDVDDLNDIERERLVACSLLQELAHRPANVESLDDISKRLVYTSNRQPSCLAHEQTLPLVVVLARGYLALGRATRALELLQAHRSAAIASGQDQRTRQATEAAILHVVRRMRLQRERSLLEEWVESNEPDQVAVAWPAAVFCGLRYGQELPLPPGADSAPRSTDGPRPGLEQSQPLELPATSEDTSSLHIIHTWNQCQMEPGRVAIVGDKSANLNRSQQLRNLPYALASVQFDFLETYEPPFVYFLDPDQPDTTRFDGLAWLHNFPGRVEEAFRLSLRFEALTDGRGQLPEALAEQVPTRRRGQIAFELGELLALRYPHKAGRLFARAITWLQAAEDPISVLQAATCQAMAMLHAGDPKADVRRYLDGSVWPHYQAAAEQLPGVLPSWSELAEQRDPGQLNPLLERAGTDWSEWINRLWYCLAATEPTLAADKDVLPAYSGSLPAELAFAAAPATPAAAKSTSRTTYVYLLIGLALFAAVLVLGYYAFNWLWNRLALKSLSTGGLIIAYLLALFTLLWLIPRAYRAIRDFVRARLAALAKVTLFINARRRDETATFQLTTQTFRLRLRPPFLAPQDDSTNWEAALPGWQSDGATLGDLDETGLAPLVTLQHALNKGSLPLRLHVRGREPNVLPWEALLACTLAPETGASPLDVLDTLRPWRSVVNHVPTSDSAPWGWQLGLIRIVASRSAALTIEEGWHGFGRATLSSTDRPAAADLEQMLPSSLSGRSDSNLQTVARDFLRQSLSSYFPPEKIQTLYRELGLDPVQLPPDQSQLAKQIISSFERDGRLPDLWDAMQRQQPGLALPYQVLHLVGTPIQTGNDLQWQISSAVETESIYKQQSIETSRLGQLFSADDLPVEHVPLILLQSEPGSDLFTDTTLDREQAGDVRAFGYKLLRAGAQAVIVLPALSYDAVPDLIRQIALAISGTEPPDLDRLLTAAQAARRTITRHLATLSSKHPVAEEGQLSLALEVCLFTAIADAEPAERTTRSE